MTKLGLLKVEYSAIEGGYNVWAHLPISHRDFDPKKPKLLGFVMKLRQKRWAAHTTRASSLPMEVFESRKRATICLATYRGYRELINE